MKDFGYKGKPNTCLWCGGKLPREKAKEYVQVETPAIFAGLPPDRHTVTRLTGEVRVGYRNDHMFCSQACGYGFGFALANKGHRLAEKG